ncbi:MAG: hypothetical protein AB1810_12720 [Pseudomonadota bacterium]
MKQSLKITLIALVGAVLAVVSNPLLQPSNTRAKLEYQRVYQELSKQSEISAQDKQRLDALFRQINAKENVQRELLELIVRNAVFFLIVAPLAALTARRSKLDTNGVFAAAGLVFLAFIVAGQPVHGALYATVFVLFGIVFKRGGASPPEADRQMPPD